MPFFTPPWDQQVAPVRVPEPHGTRWAARRRPSSAFSVPVPAAAPFTPASLPNLYAWYDASDTATITQSSGAVTQFNDKSGNGHNVSQGNASFRPTTNLHTVNSKNVIFFHDQELDSAASFSLTQPFTVFMVYNILAASQVQRAWDTQGGTGRALYNASSGTFGIYAGSVADTATSFTVALWTQMALFNGASSKVQLNGNAPTTVNPSTSNLSNVVMQIGSGSANAINSDVCDLAFCTGDQSASFSNYHGYAQSYWGAP